MIKTAILFLILVLEVSYLSYTASQEYPDLDIEEVKSELEFVRKLMEEEKLQIEQKKALWYLENVLLDSINCKNITEETSAYTNGVGIFELRFK